MDWLRERKKNVSSFVNPEPVQASPQALEKISRRNRLDSELHRWLSDRFQSLLRRTPSELRRKVPGGGRTDLARLPLWRGVGRMDAILHTQPQSGSPQEPSLV